VSVTVAKTPPIGIASENDNRARGGQVSYFAITVFDLRWPVPDMIGVWVSTEGHDRLHWCNLYDIRFDMPISVGDARRLPC